MEEAKIRLLSQRQEVIKVLLFSQQTALASLARKFKSEADNFEMLIASHILRQLRSVEKALKNADSEDFGICEICRKSIPFERLMAMPSAAHCVQCAADNDRQYRISRRNPTPRSLIISI